MKDYVIGAVVMMLLTCLGIVLGVGVSNALNRPSQACTAQARSYADFWIHGNPDMENAQVVLGECTEAQLPGTSLWVCEMKNVQGGQVFALPLLDWECSSDTD